MTRSDLPSGREQTIATEPRQVVLSPEQVELQLPIAGPTSRILAYACDKALIVLMEIGLLLLLMQSSRLPGWIADAFRRAGNGLKNPTDPDFDAAMLLFLSVFVIVELCFDITYFTLCEITTGGRSFGKRIVNLRVVRDGSLPLGVRDSLLRNVLRSVDVLPANYAVGLIAMILSSDGKRLGDLAAGTIVIRLDRAPIVEPLALDALPDDPRFRFDRAQIARLGERERVLLRQTLRRVETLPPELAGDLVARTTEALRRRIGHAEVAAEDRLGFLRALLRAAVRGV